MSAHDLHDLHLPTSGKFLTADEIQLLFERAKAHYLATSPPISQSSALDAAQRALCAGV